MPERRVFSQTLGHLVLPERRCLSWREKERTIMAEQTLQEAIWTLIQSFQETNQTITESFVVAQELSRSLAEHFFADGIEVLKANQAAAGRLLAAQEQNRKLAQRFFKDGMEILKVNQEAAESLVAAQENSVNYAQRFFTDGTELLARQMESMRTLMQELERQIKQQREALQVLARAPLESSLDVLRTPLAYYQQTLDAAETLTQQGLENFRKATQQMQDSVQRMNEQHHS